MRKEITLKDIVKRACLVSSLLLCNQSIAQQAISASNADDYQFAHRPVPRNQLSATNSVKGAKKEKKVFKLFKNNIDLCEDAEIYRVYSVNQGSRNSIENLRKAGLSIAKSGRDISYSFSSAVKNDFRGIDKSAANAGKGILYVLEDSFRLGYSALRFGTLGLAPKLRKNDPGFFMGPFVYSGRMVYDAERTVINTANTLTGNTADDILNPAEKAVSSLFIEPAKQLTQSTLNTPRYAFPDNATNAHKVMDYVSLVPTTAIANSIRGKGFSNMARDNYVEMKEEKGDTGRVLEFLPAAYFMSSQIYDFTKETGVVQDGGGSQGGITGGTVGGPGATSPKINGFSVGRTIGGAGGK